MLLALSFYGYIKTIGIGMIIYTIRNILTFYDIERRRQTIGSGEWGMLIMLQGMVTVVNLIFVNQFYVHHHIYMLTPFIIMVVLAVTGGIMYAFYTEE